MKNIFVGNLNFGATEAAVDLYSRRTELSNA